MPTNTKQVDFTKPFQFTVGDNPTVFTCNVPFEDYSLVSWKDEYETYKSTEIHISHCKKYVQDGDWTPLTNENTQQEDAMTKLEEYIRAINKNVPEEATEQPEGCEWCECPDCKAAFSEAPDNTLCNFCDEYGCDCTEPQETMLEAIKDFTLSTGASVFINEGTYEVYCFGLNNPFKAATDDMMHRLMEAISLLHEASLDN
jgi:hypothetical protein